MLVSLHIVYGCFQAIMIELWSSDKDRATHKVKHTYCLAFSKTSLPVSVLEKARQ
jgi:hypothetical protein